MEKITDEVLELLSDKKELKRYIERCDYHCKKVNEQRKIIKNLQLQLSNSVPVVHGRWVNKNDTPHCTVCDYIPAFDVALDDIYYSPFCPNCGAKMRGEDNNDK